MKTKSLDIGIIVFHELGKFQRKVDIVSCFELMEDKNLIIPQFHFALPLVHAKCENTTLNVEMIVIPPPIDGF